MFFGTKPSNIIVKNPEKISTCVMNLGTHTVITKLFTLDLNSLNI